MCGELLKKLPTLFYLRDLFEKRSLNNSQKLLYKR